MNQAGEDMHTAVAPGRVIHILGLGTAVSLLGDSTLYVVLPSETVASQLGFSLALVGVALGINRLVRVGLNGVAGWLYDRLPRRGLLVISAFLGVASTCSYAITSGPHLLLAGRLLWGAAWAGIWVGAHAMILDVSTDSSRGFRSGQFQMWFFAGVALTALTGGALTDAFGFRTGLWISAIISGLGALWWLVFLPETLPRRTGALHTSRQAGPFAWKAATAAAVPYFGNRLAFAGVLASTTIIWLGGYVDGGAELGPAFVPLATLTGGFVALRTVASLGGAPVSGRFSDWLGRRWPVMAGMLGLGALGLWLMTHASLALASAGALITAISGAGIQALSPAITGDRIPPEQQGRALGIMFSLGDLASALGPPIALYLIPLTSVAHVYRGTAFIMLAIGLFAIGQSFGEPSPQPRSGQERAPSKRASQ